MGSDTQIFNEPERALALSTMSVMDLHHEAMSLVQRALVLRHEGANDLVATLSRQALELEARAALMIGRAKAAEPTRSIMFRSAAALAMQCGENTLALILATAGLDGYPPADIRAELEAVRRVAEGESSLELAFILANVGSSFDGMAASMNSWISVNDRLPAGGDFVLCWHDIAHIIIYAEYHSGLFERHGYTGNEWVYPVSRIDGERRAGPISHWMPAPVAPVASR